MLPTQFAHYRILSKLGAGGMGEVYLAEDTRLSRRVALKVLPAKFTLDAERLRRFEQEAHAASRLNHPNVMTIYEIGEVEGMRFIATEYIEGQTLRDRLRQGRVPLNETLPLAVQLAAALSAMHNAGIAHRDLKPENIMLRTDGYVKVLDFGLAKLTETEFLCATEAAITRAETAAPTEGDTFASFLKTAPDIGKTTPGMILGTLRYMSPEQARGATVDVRTDLFSLGIILYEMLTGRLPFNGPTTGDILVALLDRTPQPLVRYAPETSLEFQGVINCLLAKDCADRYQTADELQNDLKRLQQGLPLSDSRSDWLRLALNSSGTGASNSGSEGAMKNPFGQPVSRQSSSPSRAFDSLAVLPFVNVSGKDDAAYLSEGIPESLIFNLARLPQLRVLAWSTVARYSGAQQDPLQIGRELGVRAVFAGRLHQFGDKLVIKVELVNTADGTQIWGEQYQRQLADILALEHELTEELCRNLRLRLNDSQQEHLVHRASVNPEAYQAYLQGRFYWHQRNARALKQAVAAFQRALTCDPEFAPAYVGFADCLIIVGSYGAAPPTLVMPQAKQALLKALQLNESLAEAHASMGAIYGWFEWDWVASEREFQRALQLNPAYATAAHWYASILLTALARHDEARQYQWQAHRQEPLAFVFQANLGWVEYQARDYVTAAGHCERVLELDPTYVHARFYLGLIYAQMQRYDEAVAVLQRAYELAGEGDVLLGALGYVYARAGQRDKAAALVSELMPRLAEGKSSYFFLALIYAGLGETESAIQALEGAIEERCSYLIHLGTEPIFDGLHTDARFHELLRTIGLPT